MRKIKEAMKKYYFLLFLMSYVLAQTPVGSVGSGCALHFNNVPAERVFAETNYDPTQAVNPGKIFNSATGSFTYELWVKPNKTIVLPPEQTTGITGTSGQSYAIFPEHGGCYAWCTPTDVGVGVSVGTNGVAVFEHAHAHLPALLVWSGSIPSSNFTHIAVVIDNNTYNLYINGIFIKQGLTSTKTCHPSGILGDNLVAGVFSNYGPFSGEIDEVRIWNYARTITEIRRDMCRTLTGNEPGLIAYWKLDECNGTTVLDSSPNGNNGTLY